MKFIDSHCHIIDDKLWEKKDLVINEAKEVGVEKFITMGGSPADWERLKKIKDPNVYTAYGWHPEDFIKVESLDQLKKMIEEDARCIAIGEVGLDFYRDTEKKSKNVQMKMICDQIELALELEKPLIIHVRNAEEEMNEILDKYGADIKAHFHCFGESPELLKRILALNCVVSFGGNITFKSAENLREMLKLVPMDQLLLETDSPYLSPEPRRGTLNTPSNLPLTAQFIAKELKIEVEDLALATYKNTVCFFGLEN